MGVSSSLRADSKSVPLLVPRRELDGATAANSVGYNLSRAVGPAIAGIAIQPIAAIAKIASESTVIRGSAREHECSASDVF